MKILLLPCCLTVGVRALIKEIPLAPLLSWYIHRLLVSSLLANPKCNALPTPFSPSLSFSFSFGSSYSSPYLLPLLCPPSFPLRWLIQLVCGSLSLPWELNHQLWELFTFTSTSMACCELCLTGVGGSIKDTCDGHFLFCSTGYGDDSPFGVCELHDPFLDSYIHWTGSCLLLGNSMDEHDTGQ